MPRAKTKPIYLDYAATTPVLPEVLATMRPYFTQLFGNPSSLHFYGQQALAAVDRARDTVAQFLNCDRAEVHFTASATESNNWALQGAVAAARRRGRRRPQVIVSAIEHKSVLATAQAMQNQGLIRLRLAPVTAEGIVDIDQLFSLINDQTTLVSVQYVNSELGSQQPVRVIGRHLAERRRKKGSPFPIFHCDAVQAALVFDVRPEKLACDLLTLNAHKIYGPKGAALLYIKKQTPIDPLIRGGGQEYNRRSGTENVPALVGLAAVLQRAWDNREANHARLASLKKRLLILLREKIPALRLNGSAATASPAILNLSLPGLAGDELMIALDQAGFAVSTGSACQARSAEPSYVLRAIGRSRQASREGLRVSLGMATSTSEVDAFAATLAKIARAIKR